MKKRIALTAALLLGLCLAAAAWAQGLTKQDLVREAKSRISQVTPPQALEMQRTGSVLLDCREPEEFAEGHAPGAVNIPRGLLEFRIAKLIPNPKTSIVMYCMSGSRSSLSVCTLTNMGYANTVNLDGGYNAWVQAGLPLEKDAPTAAEAQHGLPAEPDAAQAAAGAKVPGKEDLVREAKDKITQVSPAQATQMQTQGGVVLDCRETDEFVAGHVPGALHIPRGLLEFKIAAAIPDQQTPIVLYCKTGGRASLGVCALASMGYTSVVNLDGGWRAWVKAGLPVERSEAAAAPAIPAVPAATGEPARQELRGETKAQVRALDMSHAKF